MYMYMRVEYLPVYGPKIKMVVVLPDPVFRLDDSFVSLCGMGDGKWRSRRGGGFAIRTSVQSIQQERRFGGQPECVDMAVPTVDHLIPARDLRGWSCFRPFIASTAWALCSRGVF